MVRCKQKNFSDRLCKSFETMIIELKFCYLIGTCFFSQEQHKKYWKLLQKVARNIQFVWSKQKVSHFFFTWCTLDRTVCKVYNNMQRQYNVLPQNRTIILRHWSWTLFPLLVNKLFPTWVCTYYIAIKWATSFDMRWNVMPTISKGPCNRHVRTDI